MKVECRLIWDIIVCVGLCALCVDGKTACTRTSSNISIQLYLNCSKNQMIHVVSELIGHADNSSMSCRVSRTIANCSEYRTTDRTGLTANCNGHSSCYEVISTSRLHCPGDGAVEIEYECIEGSVDIGTGQSVTDGGPLYVHSPGFPDNNKNISYYQCTITGVNMNVMILHYRAKYGAFYIRNGTDDVWPTSNYSTVAYNRKLPKPYNGNLTVYYNNTGDGNELAIWIKITGAKNISCTNSTLSWSSTTVQTATHVNTSPSVDKTDSTTVNRTSSAETTTLKTSKASTPSRPTTTSSTTVGRTSSTETTKLKTHETPASPGQTTTNSTIVDRTSATESSSLNESITSTSPGKITTDAPLPIVWIAAALGIVVVVVTLTTTVVCLLCRCHRRKSDNTVNGYDIPEKDTPAISHDYEPPPVNNYCEIDLGHLDPSFGTDAEKETLKLKETPLHHYFECDSNFTKSGSPVDCNHSDDYGWPGAANGIKGGQQKANHANTYDHLDTWNYDDTKTAERDVDVCLGAKHVFDESHVVDQGQSHMVDNDIYCGGSDDGTASSRLSDMNLPPKYKPAEGQSVDRSHMVDNDIYCGGSDDGTASSRLSDMNLPPKYKHAEGQSVDRSHMVDNDIYCGGPSDEIRQTDNSPSRKSSSISSPPESRSTGRQLGDQSHMVDNDIYVGGPADDDASCSRSSSINLPRKSKPTERQLYDEIDINELKGHEGNVKDDDDGWVANDVYHSYSDV